MVIKKMKTKYVYVFCDVVSDVWEYGDYVMIDSERKYSDVEMTKSLKSWIGFDVVHCYEYPKAVDVVMSIPVNEVEDYVISDSEVINVHSTFSDLKRHGARKFGVYTSSKKVV